jgi:hypothetical protein
VVRAHDKRPRFQKAPSPSSVSAYTTPDACTSRDREQGRGP